MGYKADEVADLNDFCRDVLDVDYMGLSAERTLDVHELYSELTYHDSATGARRWLWDLADDKAQDMVSYFREGQRDGREPAAGRRMNASLLRFLEGLVAAYEGACRRGLSNLGLVDFAERALAGEVPGVALRAPEPYAYAADAGIHIVSSVDRGFLGYYPDVIAWADRSGISQDEILAAVAAEVFVDDSQWRTGLECALESLSRRRGVPMPDDWAASLDLDEEDGWVPSFDLGER